MRGPLLVVIPILLIAALAYAGWRLWRIVPFGWPVKLLALLLFAAGAVAMFAGFTRLERMPIKLATVVYEVGNTWLIGFLYLLLAFAVLEAGRAARIVPEGLLRDSAPGTLCVLGAVALVLCLGGLHYRHKYREDISVRTDKPLERPLKIVLASDLHLGYHNRRPELARWIDLINAENPDLVLFGGDIIDRSVRPLLEGDYAAEFRRLQAPVMAVLGNHEYYGSEPCAEQFYRDAGITLLRDSVAVIDGIAVVGRDDRSNAGRATLAGILRASPSFSSPSSPTASIPTSDSASSTASIPQSGLTGGRFTLMLDHQPYHLDEAETCGIDFQFSGHTHRGQVWPVSWITDAMYEKSWGRHSRGATQYYVSSGLGIWGAKVRVGTRSEYLVLSISPR